MNATKLFSPDYATARQRFREAATRLGWRLEHHALDIAGPAGEELSVDVASSPDRASLPDHASGQTLVLSSGVHGVEGFFGSAVQLDLLEHWARESPPPLPCVFLHGLNPYGFAWLRRFDEQNVDPNRNFLLDDEAYSGCPPVYAELDALLNPRQPPSHWDLFPLRAAAAIARYGMPALRESVAGGQYEYPRGLFFGGSGPSGMFRLLEQYLGCWLEGSRRVVHLDFHTGLGRSGSWKLLVDHPLSPPQQAWLTNHFGPDSFETSSSSRVAYDTRGSLGRWCVARQLADDYLYVCAEFGTYAPLWVLGGLRAENQAHHWGQPQNQATVRARQQLKELFCPSSARWRSSVLEQARDLVLRALRGMTV